MSYIREETGTIIICGGRVYASFKQEPVETNDVCQLCALKYECITENCKMRYHDLCEANESCQEVFFLEVKPSTKLTIFDVATDQNIYEACDSLCWDEFEL